MNNFVSLLILFFITTPVFSTTLDCTGIHNTSTVFTQRVNLNLRSEITLPKLAYVSSKIKSLGNNQYEIEVFNPNASARGYSTAVLKNSGDFLKWASWDREAIFEIACIQRP
jgi:hypothetical protein